MKRLLTALLLTICFCVAAAAQNDTDAKTKSLLAQAAKNGNALRSQIVVNGNVHAQAVLIPRVDARRIFGGEIAKNYAVVEVNIGNKSPDAAFIIHGVFIDYRNWPLSGSAPDDRNRLRSTDSYQESAFPNEVASEEYRVVRGQLLDASTDTLRNRFMRWLTLAGNLAGAYTFSLNEQGIVKGIAAATGVGIPGVATAWPDKTIEQLNRVSDFGFRANKVIPKEGSDVIVCFFPIDRFLTPGFRKLFLKSPSLFFAPLLMLADRSVAKDVEPLIKDMLGDSGVTLGDMRMKLPCYMKVRHPDPDRLGYDVCLEQFGLEEKEGGLWVDPDNNASKKKFAVFLALEFIGGVSLNRVTITVDGVMAVDVKTIAARIDEVATDKVADCGDAGSECFWTNLIAAGGARTGVIRGAFMNDGTAKIAEASALGIESLTKLDSSTDDEVHFSFKLTKPIDNQTKLHFTVTKPAPSAGTQPLESNTYEYLVAYSPTAPGVDAAVLSSDKKTVAVTLRRISSAPVRFVLHPDAGSDVPVPAAAVTPDANDRNKFTIAIDGLKLNAGCWAVQASAGGLASNTSNKFPVGPTPTIETATRTQKFIQVTGKDLIDFSHCGGNRLTFKLLKDGETNATSVDVDNWNNGKPLLKMSDDVKKDTWKGKVQVFLDGAKKSEVPLS